MTVLQKLKRKKNNSPLLQNMYIASMYILHFVPFYLVEEGNIDEKQPVPVPKIDTSLIKISVLDNEQIKTLFNNIEIIESKETSLPDMDLEGWICIGVIYNNKIISYMWCNLIKCYSELLQFKLKKNEAYLSHAYTIKEYRGKNLAPYLRLELYKYLRKIGRTKFFSMTLYLNEPALRFKKKLNAKPVKLYLNIHLMKKKSFNVVLKHYL